MFAHSKAAFAVRQQSGAAGTETAWPTKPEVFPLRPGTEKFVDPDIDNCFHFHCAVCVGPAHSRWKRGGWRGEDSGASLPVGVIGVCLRSGAEKDSPW